MKTFALNYLGYNLQFAEREVIGTSDNIYEVNGCEYYRVADHEKGEFFDYLLSKFNRVKVRNRIKHEILILGVK